MAKMGHYKDGRPFPPENEWVPHVFRRAEVFYVINLPEGCDLQDQADCNPGTLRIEDMTGKQLWPPAPKEV